MVEIWQALALGGFAGFVNYLQRFASDKDPRPSWEWGSVGVKAVTGSFVGLLTLWIVGKKLENEYAAVAIAIAGYGGPLTLDAGWQLGKDVATLLVNRAANGPKDNAPKN